MTKSNTVKKIEDAQMAARPCLNDMPYRALVFAKLQNQTPLYWVAGSEKNPRGAENALRLAFEKHGGNCFLCKNPIMEGDLTIDHVESKSVGGSNHIQNLLITHKSCNVGKANNPIEAFNPDAGREWLESLLKQVQDRLNRIK